MRIWNKQEWETLRYDKQAAKVALEGRGYSVRGFSNQKPILEEPINDEELQTIIAAVISGEAISVSGGAPKPTGSKKRGKRGK